MCIRDSSCRLRQPGTTARAPPSAGREPTYTWAMRVSDGQSMSGDAAGLSANPPREREAPAGPAQALGLRPPEFFIAGHQKCGTTALYAMLRKHPQIFMPDVK